MTSYIFQKKESLVLYCLDILGHVGRRGWGIWCISQWSWAAVQSRTLKSPGDQKNEEKINITVVSGYRPQLERKIGDCSVSMGCFWLSKDRQIWNPQTSCWAIKWTRWQGVIYMPSFILTGYYKITLLCRIWVWDSWASWGFGIYF